MQKVLVALVSGFLTLGVAVCALYDWSAFLLERGLAAAVDTGTAQISFRQLVKKPWERVYIFDCYASPVQVSRTIGFAYSDSNVLANQHSEGGNLLLFVKARRVILSVLHRRNRGDFYPHAVDRSFTPNEAVFETAHLPQDVRVLFRPLGGLSSLNLARSRAEDGTITS